MQPLTTGQIPQYSSMLADLWQPFFRNSEDFLVNSDVSIAKLKKIFVDGVKWLLVSILLPTLCNT